VSRPQQPVSKLKEITAAKWWVGGWVREISQARNNGSTITFHEASIKLNATAQQLHVRSQSNTQMDTVTMKRMVCAQTNNSEMDTFDMKTEESAPNPYENFMKDFNKMVIQWKQ
jgi:hypothetical protein